MAFITFPKVRRQDFRTGLEKLERLQKKEAETHDKWVSDLSTDTLRAIWSDLSGRPCWDKRNPEHRWTMGRRAAVGRALMARGAI